MPLPVEKTIKREKEDYESDSAEYLIPELEVTVKVEVENSHVNPWEVKTEFISDDKPVCLGLDFGNSDWVDYEKLIEYKRLQCTICNEQFYERYSVLRHNLDHLKLDVEPLKKCPFCPEHFPTENEWSIHIESNHYGNEILEKELMDLRITKTLHQCRICGKIQTYKALHSHMREVHSMGNNKCSICNAVFKCARYLRKHVKSIHENRKFRSEIESEEKCSLCPAVLRCKNALKTHMRNCHSEKAQCQLCKSVLKSKTYLHTHMRRVHYNDGTVHKCFCGKSFHSPRYLKVHKKNAHSR